MTDEIASSVLSGSTKAVETALELIKMLAPGAKNALSSVLKVGKTGAKAIFNGVEKKINKGTISNAKLISEAEKAKCRIMSESNFLSRDVDIVVQKAEKYKIPIAVVGEGEKKTVEFLERDKAVMKQITQEIIQERLKEAPESVKSFSVSKDSAAAMKSMLQENGIECQFVQTANDKILCVFPTEYAEQVAVIKNDFQNAYTNIEENFGIAPNVPETERQLEIRSQIEEITNSHDNAELRGKVYDEIAENKEIEFPKYSEKNMERVFEQMPEAKKVAGKAFWEKQGYKLNENAKGVEIIAPQVDENGKPVLDENGKQIFTSITVYDVSETNAFEKSIDKQINELQREYDKEKMVAFSKSEDRKVVLSDELNGNSVEITVDNKIHKSDVTEILREKLGYSEMQAEMAANKLCKELNLDEEKFNANSQVDNLNALKTNIRYQSDDISIRDVRFDAVNFKDGDTTHILLQNGDNSVVLP